MQSARLTRAFGCRFRLFCILRSAFCIPGAVPWRYGGGMGAARIAGLWTADHGLRDQGGQDGRVGRSNPKGGIAAERAGGA
jgi:hypothetical protein